MISILDWKIDGTVCIQLNKTICAGSITFLKKAKPASSKFSSKPKEIAKETGNKFNGINISTENVIEVKKQVSYSANI